MAASRGIEAVDGLLQQIMDLFVCEQVCLYLKVHVCINDDEINMHVKICFMDNGKNLLMQEIFGSRRIQTGCFL